MFPGTNCEYDTARAFEKAGAQVETLVFKNLKTQDVEASVAKLTEVIKQSQIIALPGGFSAGMNQMVRVNLLLQYLEIQE